MIGRIPGPALLWYSIIVFGAAGSIVHILAELGTQHTVDGRNVISFCNLLFAGNACAVIVLFAVHRKQWTLQNLRKLTNIEWLFLFILALLANCLAPWLFFVAIESTMVTNVVLVSQIEPPLLLFLAWLVFKDRIGKWSFIGSTICLLGVALIALLQPQTEGLIIGRGEIYAGLAAVIYAASIVLAKLFLNNVPLGIFSVFRSAVGTIVFFIIASYLFGLGHFVDIGSPFLWKWMLIYGGIIIVSGQLAWDTGVRKSQSTDVSLATSFAPISGVLAAYLILGEQPSQAHYIGGAVLLIGIAICLYATLQKLRQEKLQVEGISEKEAVPSLEAECRTGFKGV